MANFKGGFAFNNEAAKVEVEQSPNGALISCINPVTGESMGGGNPNSVQVIESTADNIFKVNTIGSVEKWDELWEAIYSYNASAKIEFDTSSIGEGVIVLPIVAIKDNLDHNFSASGALIGETVSTAILAYWGLSGSVLDCILKTFGRADISEGVGTITSLLEYASQIPATLTIYRHPMPEAEGE